MMGFEFEDSQASKQDQDRQSGQRGGENRITQGIVDLGPAHSVIVLLKMDDQCFEL